MREELSDDEVRHQLELFFQEIEHHFEDVGVKVETMADGVACLSTDLSQKECDDRVKRCLNGLDLYARKLSSFDASAPVSGSQSPNRTSIHSCDAIAKARTTHVF